jgi:hypothetical protein
MSFHSNPLHHEFHIPKVEVNKFDGSDPMGWVTQLEHYFSLYAITNDLTKLRIDVLYLDPECWKWWKWCKNSHQGYITWTQFVAYLYEHFNTDMHHLGLPTHMYSFEVVYCQKPHFVLSYLLGVSKVSDVDNTLTI